VFFYDNIEEVTTRERRMQQCVSLVIGHVSSFRDYKEERMPSLLCHTLQALCRPFLARKKKTIRTCLYLIQ